MEKNNKERALEISKRLQQMRLPIMANELLMMIESEEYQTILFLEGLDRISSNEQMSRKNNTIQRLKKQSGLSQVQARLENLEYRPERKINKNIIEQLSTNDYIGNHRNVIILGACGTGKSFLCNALGMNALEELYTVKYVRMFELLAQTNIYESLSDTGLKQLEKYVKPNLLIIDDFLIHPVTIKETETLFRLFEYRYHQKSTIVCSQLEPEEWHRHLGSGILADSILDRILPNAYTLILSGDSLRTEK